MVNTKVTLFRDITPYNLKIRDQFLYLEELDSIFFREIVCYPRTPDPNSRAIKGVGLWRSRAGAVGSNHVETWISVSCECCVLPGSDFCHGSITRPEDFYRVLCV
jgi:hypothetical protein